MARASFYGVDIHTPQDVDGGEGTPGRMAGDKFPFRDQFGDEFPVLPFLQADNLRETYILHQLVQFRVIVPDVRKVRGTVVVLFQDAVGCLRVDGIEVYVHDGPAPGLLLGNRKDIPLKAVSVNPHHIGMALRQVARKDEKVADPVHLVPEILPAGCVEAVNVEIRDAGHIVGG